ncbi:hypothetical protein [Bacillus xiapuensis]|uniref:hypothetical protein n=1 Tax=Bacillus xiapuensis TaxID=2014075 RepID=UPI000C238A4B|nr:hypothetical protein [Bacillus xiapuensis]
MRLEEYVGEFILVELTGETELAGLFFELGEDVMVLYKETEFFYIPFFHVKNIKRFTASGAASPSFKLKTAAPFPKQLCLEEILETAKGLFVEITVSNGHVFHGCITVVMNDYIVFFSPVFQTILIPIQHIIQLLPYPHTARPYGFKNSSSLTASTDKTFAVTFDGQLNNMTGSFLTCNIGSKDAISGKLLDKEKHCISLLTSRETEIHLNIQHIQSLMCP